MADGGPQCLRSDSVKAEIRIVIASLQKSVPPQVSLFSEDFVDEEIVDRFVIENISEDEQTWLKSEFDGVESLETENVETWLTKQSPKPTFILSTTANSNSSYVSGIGKHTNPYLTFVRPKRPNIDTSRLTIFNIADHNVIGDGTPNLDHESDSSMASSLLLDSHVAHLDKTGVLNFDDQTESESLQNCLNQTITRWEANNGETTAENQTVLNKTSSVPPRKPLMTPIMGRSYTKLPFQQLRYDSPPPLDDKLSDSFEDLNFNSKFSHGKQSEFDSRTYRKSAVKSRERLIMSSERNGLPFSILNNGNLHTSTPLVNYNAFNPNSDQVFKTPTLFDSSTFSRSQLKNRKAVPFSGLQIKNSALIHSESPGNFETFTIAKQNNGVINIDPEYLENSLDYISEVQTPTLENIDTDLSSQDPPFISSHNLNSTVVLDKEIVDNIENGHVEINNDTVVIESDDNDETQISNQMYDTNQNISHTPVPLSMDAFNTTYEIPDDESYLCSAPKLVKRLSVSHDNGLEKISPPKNESRRSFSDHKPAIPRGPLKYSKLSLPVRRSLYSSNTNIRKQVDEEEPNLIESQQNATSASNLRALNYKSGLRRPMSGLARPSDVKYYNLTDKKNVLNSTFCKSATNLSASYIVEKHNSVEDVSRGSMGSSSSSILSNSSCISASNCTIDQVMDPVELKKGNEHLFESPTKTSTPKSNAARNRQFSDDDPSAAQASPQDEQLNFQPFPNSQLQSNQKLNETVSLSSSHTPNRLVRADTLTMEPTFEPPPKLPSESTFIRPQRTSGLRMPSVRPPAPSRLPTATAPTSSIPRFASRLPTFSSRMRIPAPVKK